MPRQTIIVPPPIGGVNRALARSQQPKEPLPTCWDALNMVPYDRFGRLRVSQRSGTTPVWATPIGDGTQNVQLLGQVTRVNIPAVAGSYPDPFTSPSFSFNTATETGNGHIEAIDAAWDAGTSNTATVAISTYLARFDGSRGGAWNQDPLTFADASNRLFISDTPALGGGTPTNAGSAAAFTTANATATDNFRVLLSGLGNSSQGNFADSGAYIILSVRVNVANPLGDQTGVISVWFHPDATGGEMRIFKGTTLVNSSTGVFGVPDYLGIQVAGDAVTVWINDKTPDGGGATVVFTETITGQTTSHRGIAFGGIWASLHDSGIVADDGVQPHAAIFETTGTAGTPAQPRQTNIVAVSGGNIYQGQLTVQGTLTTGGSGALNSDNTVLPSMAAIFGKAYFVDGSSDLKVLDIATATTTTWVGTAGAETATTLGKYKLAAIYRGRLVLANTTAAPQNFVCSRVGVPTDFDYSQEDPAAAFAGNASENGRIGEPITALMPINADIMLIGGDHNLWAMRGDPAANGAIDLVSDQIGVLGKDAWCQNPLGTVYFVGTGGFYKMEPESKPESIADVKFNQFFANINRSTNVIQCVWDRDRRGCYIFVTSIVTGASTHVWYDERTGGTYWPLQYPDSFGPISSLVYDGDGPNDRRIILGTRDGKLLQWQDNSRSDNDNGVGTAIQTHVTLGPFSLGSAAKLVGTTFEFGELSLEDQPSPGRWQANVFLQAGPTAYDVTEGTPFQITQIQVGLDRRTKTFRQRLRGSWFTVRIENHSLAQYFVLDNLTLDFDTAGKERRQR